MACKLYCLDLHGDGQSLGVLSVLLNQTFRNQWNHHEEKTERHCSIEPKFLIEAIHLRFDRNFDYCLAKWDCKREFGTASFGPPDRTVKEDHLWRWTTLTGKFPLGPKRSIYFLELTENSNNFGTMESNPHCKVFSVKGAISGEEKKGIEKLAKVFLPGVAIRDDNCYLKNVYYNSE